VCWLLFGLLYTTGMRVGEALAVEVDDLDLSRDDEHVTVLGKGGRRRTVLLDDVPLSGFHLRVTAYTTGGMFCDGYILGMVGIALAVWGPQVGLSSFEDGLIGASALAGIFLGALVFGPITDRVGRQTMYLADLVLFIVGSALQLFVTEPWQLVALRLVMGVAIGADYAIGAALLSEFLPRRQRGPLLASLNAVWTVGFVVAFVVGYLMRDLGDDSWRWMLASSAIPALIVLFLRLGTPESPRWLARKDRWEECHDVLALVHGKGDRNSPFVLRELSEIKEMCEFERQNADVTYLELLKPNMINRTHIGVFTQIWSQLTGMNVMMYYITYVFSMAGLTGNNLLLSSSIQYIINVLMTVPALLWVDRWGRRPTLLVGAAFMTTWMFANAGLLKTYGAPAPPGGLDHIQAESWQISGPASKAVIACTYLFVASFAPSWGPVSWIYPPELYPLRVRGKAVALATSANWAFNFALGYFVPPAFVNIQWEVYVLFGVFGVCMFVHVFFMFPETAGKTLEETEEMFTDPAGPKYIGTPAWKTRVVTRQVLMAEKGEIDPDQVFGYHNRGGSVATDPEAQAATKKSAAVPTATTTEEAKAE